MGVRNHDDRGTLLEGVIREGENPVPEIVVTPGAYLSKTEHEKFCLNLGGPPSKAKYGTATDSETVP